MSRERNSLRIGIVMVFTVTVFFVVLIWISQRVGGEMRTITIRFKATPAMPTLVPGSAILVGGHKVGKVLSVELDRLAVQDAADSKGEEAYYLLVQCEIREDLDVRTDCTVFAEGPPLGGDGIVKIDLGAAEDPISPDQIIEGSPPAGLGAALAALQSELDADNPDSLLGRIKSQLDPDAEASLMAKLLLSLDDINHVTAGLSRELDVEQKAALLAKIHEVVDNINTTTGSLRTEFDSQRPSLLLGKVHLAMDTVNDGLATLAGILKSSEAPVARTLESVEATAENISRETDPANVDGLLAHFKEGSKRLNASLADINAVTETTRQVVVLNRENVSKLLLNLKESSDHIKTGVKYVLRHPWRLLNEPAIKEIKQQAIFDAARCFSEAATRIDDATSQLRVLAELYEGNIPADHPDLARISADLNRTREAYQKAEAELWRQLGID